MMRFYRHGLLGFGITAILASLISDHRVDAFMHALKRVDRVPKPEFIKVGNCRIAGGVAAITELLSLKDRPAAVLAANDLAATGGMRAAMKMGVSIPHDLSIIGFDDIELSEIVHPPLTTLRHRSHLPTYNAGGTIRDTTAPVVIRKILRVCRAGAT